MKLARLREVAGQLAAHRGPSPSRTKYLQEAAQLLEAEFSHDEIRQRLYSALRADSYAPNGSYIYRWIARVYGAFFIYSEEVGDADARLFKRDYSLDESGGVTLGEAIEVRSETRYVAVSTGEAVTSIVSEADERDAQRSEIPQEILIGTPKQLSETSASRVLWLCESAESQAHDVARIKIIAPGQGSSGYYSREMLERDIPAAFPIGTHMYANHPSASEMIDRPERDVRDLAATIISTPVYEADNPEGEGAYADCKIYGSWLGFVKERKADIGLSINAMGMAESTAEGGWEITSIEEGLSVDFVTRAGAGGKIVSLQEAAQDAGQLTRESAPEGQGDTVTEQEAQALRDRVATLEAENTRLANANAVQARAQIVAAEALKESALPQAVKDRLSRAAIESAPRTEAGELDESALTQSLQEAATQEATFAAEAYGFTGADTSPVHGMGGSATGTVRESASAPSEADGVISMLGL